MITVLFENDAILKETSFGSDLLYQTELDILKREKQDLNSDLNLLKPNVLFVDLHNNSQGFIEKIKSVRAIDAVVKIILLVDFYSEHICWIAKKLELNGILQKDVNLNEFMKMVKSTVTNSNYSCCESHRSTVDIEQIVENLSNTEITVFKFIGKGFTSQEISDSLGLSKRTIEHHKAKILTKLNCKNSSKLTYVATLYNLFQIF